MHCRTKLRTHRFIRSNIFDLLVCLAIALVLVLLSSGAAFAQNVGINTATPHAKALLEMSSTDKGVLVPRLTAAQRAAIFPAPDATGKGMLVFQTDAPEGFHYYDGTTWVFMDPAGSAAATGWEVDANAGTDPTTHFVGTTDAQPLVMRTGNAERTRITAAGDVGIGTTNPQHGLHVVRSSTNAVLGLRNLNDAAVGGVNYYGSAGTLGAVTGWSNAGHSISPGSLLHGTLTNTPVSFITNSLERMRISNGGNVGIGTTTPSVRLELNDNAGLIPMRVRNTLNNGYSVTQYYNLNNTAWGHVGMVNPGAANHAGNFIVGSASASPVSITTSDVERIRVAPNGNVGIGTSVTNVRLHVAADQPDVLANFHNANNNGYAGIHFDHATAGRAHIGMGNPGSIWPSLGYTGTVSAHPFVFTTNNLERMRLTADGKLGLHTTGPQADLDIISSDAALPALRVMNTLPGASAIARFSNTTGTAHLNIGFVNSVSMGYLGTSGPQPLAFYSDNMERMRIDGSTGNVGIGTLAPQWKLDVHAAQSVGRFVSSGNPNGSVIELRNMNPGAGGTLGAINFNNAADNYPGQIGYTADHAMTFRAGGQTSERMRIDGLSGNVGIGTAAPQAALEVNGYTKLGSDAPAIRVKKLTGTTANAQGGWVDIAHGIAAGKVLAVTVLIEYTAGQWIPTSYSNAPGYSCNFVVNGTNVRLINESANSGSILSKPVKILLTYEA